MTFGGFVDIRVVGGVGEPAFGDGRVVNGGTILGTGCWGGAGGDGDRGLFDALPILGEFNFAGGMVLGPKPVGFLIGYGRIDFLRGGGDDDDVIPVEGALGNDEDACDEVFDKGGDAQTDDKGKDA